MRGVRSRHMCDQKGLCGLFMCCDIPSKMIMQNTKLAHNWDHRGTIQCNTKIWVDQKCTAKEEEMHCNWRQRSMQDPAWLVGRCGGWCLMMKMLWDYLSGFLTLDGSLVTFSTRSHHFGPASIKCSGNCSNIFLSIAPLQIYTQICAVEAYKQSETIPIHNVPVQCIKQPEMHLRRREGW